MRDPKNSIEWQEAVDTAELMLLLDSAICYGLVTGPKVDVMRCSEILRRGAKLGFRPKPHAELLAGLGA